jgi:hypothetical protein
MMRQQRAIAIHALGHSINQTPTQFQNSGSAAKILSLGSTQKRCFHLG